MSKSHSQETKAKIAASRKATKERRKLQSVITREIQLFPNKQQKELLIKMFLQAKWFYNHMIGDNLLFNENFKTSIKEVPVRYVDKETGEITSETRQITQLPAHVKQSIRDQAISNIKGLSTKKKKGSKVGRLKCKSEVNSLLLKEFNTDFKLNLDSNKAFIAKIGWMKTRGMYQISEYMSIANARVIHKNSKFYIQVTCFVDKQLSNIRPTKRGKYVAKPSPKKKALAFDLGIKDSITTSDGEKFNISVKETEKLKNLQRDLARSDRLAIKKKTKKHSNNRKKTISKIRREYSKMRNQKKDMANKVMCYLTSQATQLVTQDDSIKGWHKGLFGKAVQHSCLGTIKSMAKQKGVMLVSKWESTTKECLCGHRNDIGLDARTFVCEKCGYTEHRDTKSAKKMLQIAGFEEEIGDIILEKDVVDIDINQKVWQDVDIESYLSSAECTANELESSVNINLIDISKISTLTSEAQCL